MPLAPCGSESGNCFGGIVIVDISVCTFHGRKKRGQARIEKPYNWDPRIGTAHAEYIDAVL
jgi:hypothetical protein